MTESFVGLCEAAETLLACAVRERAEHFEGASRRRRKRGLSEFDADKTMRLFNKLWRTHHDLGGPPCRLATLPVDDLDDKHGRRIAFTSVRNDGQDRWNPDKERPSVLDLIIADDKVSPPDARLFAVEEIPREWGVERRISAHITGEDLARLAEQHYIARGDISLVQQFGQTVGPLSENEIIALGRHETADATRESIVFEFRRWAHWALLAASAFTADVAQDARRAKQAGHFAWQAWSFAREAKTKAWGEHLHYRRGFRMFIERAAATPLRRAFVDVQHKEDDIWLDPHVAVLRFPAYYCWEVSTYILGTLGNLPLIEPIRKPRSVTLEVSERSWSRLAWLGGHTRHTAPSDFRGEYTGDTPRHSRWSNLPRPSVVATGDAGAFVSFLSGAQRLAQHVTDEFLAPFLSRRMEP